MNVLISGGAGFVGSHLVASQLGLGHRVRAVDLQRERLCHLAENPRLEIVAGDIADKNLLAHLVDGIDVVYHLASAHLEISVPDAHYWKINVEATENLLVAAQAAGVKRVVHCSSVGVIGEVARPPADETTPCQPTTIYERTKLAGERAALRYSSLTGLPVVVARPAWVYGPGCPRTRKLFRAIEKRRFVMVGTGRTLRHPIYVTDAVRGLELCAEVEKAAGQVYILAGEEPVTIAALVQRIAEVCGLGGPAVRIPVPLAKAAGTVLQTAFKPFRIEPPFSRRSVDFFLKDNAYDITKARSELSFDPQIGLHEGLVRTLRWLRNKEGEDAELARGILTT